jgi:DNA-directed RNA polymerase alpha subunit
VTRNDAPNRPTTGSALCGDSVYRGLEELELSARAWRTLARTGIRTIGDLVDKSDDQLRSIRGMGEKTYSEIKVKLKQYMERSKP